MNAGLVDEIAVGLVPVPLGGGVRLFANLTGNAPDLEITRAVASDRVTHRLYRMAR